MVNQRSKSGCWTCRLRRKKCPEDGLPCSNCASRGVDCHGYGPRPAWKDRGHQEKQEMDRLQLRRRGQGAAPRRLSSSSSTGNNSTVGTDTCLPEQQGVYGLSPSMAFASPAADMVLQPALPPPPPLSFSPPSFSPPGLDTTSFSFASSSPTTHLDPSTLTLMPDFWVPDFENLSSMTPFGDATSSITIPPHHPLSYPPPLLPAVKSLEDTASNSDPTPLTSPTITTTSTASTAGAPLPLLPPGLDLASNSRLPPSEEREIELMMQYLEEDFPKQHPSYGAPAVRVQAWLMCSFRRSSTFLYASLCMSAYFNFLKAPPHDAVRRTELFREYDQFRKLAARAHGLLVEATAEACDIGETGGGGERSQAQYDFILGEKIISSVQLAILESIGENHDHARSYLDSASLALIQYHDHGSFIDSQQTVLPAASAMERKAVEFFTCVLIWIHILHCSTRQAMPRGVGELYRQLLARHSPFVKSFVEIVGFEGWVLATLMDAIEVSVWKREQEERNRLSMRELIGRTDSIVFALNQQVQQSHHVQTQIFAHAVAVHAHTISSGYQPAVPEIQQTLERAIPLWQKLSPDCNNLKRLSWAFCVSASLASEAQRSVFEKVLSDASSVDSLYTTVSFLRTIVEECWRILDAGVPSCNWQDVMHKMERNIHGILFT